MKVGIPYNRFSESSFFVAKNDDIKQNLDLLPPPSYAIGIKSLAEYKSNLFDLCDVEVFKRETGHLMNILLIRNRVSGQLGIGVPEHGNHP